MTVLTCFCSCPDTDTARRIARALVEARLAACVQIVPGIESVYRWQGRVEQASETLLLAKTRRERLQALTTRIVELHPYEVPEVLAMETDDRLAAYLDWIRAQTQAEAGA